MALKLYYCHFVESTSAFLFGYTLISIHLFHCVGHFEFCEVDDDEFEVDYVFRTAFGGSRGFSFSFTHDEDEPRWRHHSSRYSNNSKRSWRSKYRLDEDEEEDEDDYTSESSDSESEPNQVCHRQALGLSPSGPLNLKDVKHA